MGKESAPESTVTRVCVTPPFTDVSADRLARRRVSPRCAVDGRQHHGPTSTRAWLSGWRGQSRQRSGSRVTCLRWRRKLSPFLRLLGRGGNPYGRRRFKRRCHPCKPLSSTAEGRPLDFRGFPADTRRQGRALRYIASIASFLGQEFSVKHQQISGCARPFLPRNPRSCQTSVH